MQKWNGAAFVLLWFTFICTHLMKMHWPLFDQISVLVHIHIHIHIHAPQTSTIALHCSPLSWLSKTILLLGRSGRSHYCKASKQGRREQTALFTNLSPSIRNPLRRLHALILSCDLLHVGHGSWIREKPLVFDWGNQGLTYLPVSSFVTHNVHHKSTLNAP